MICASPTYDSVVPLIKYADNSSQGSCEDVPASPSPFLRLDVGDVDSITSSQLRSPAYRSAKSASFSPMLRERSSSCPPVDTPGTSSSRKWDWCFARLPGSVSPLSHTSLSNKQMYGSPTLTRTVREIIAYSPTGCRVSLTQDLPSAHSYPPSTNPAQKSLAGAPDHSDTIGAQPAIVQRSLQADSPSTDGHVSSDRHGSSSDSCPAITCSPLPFVTPPVAIGSLSRHSPIASPLSGLSGPSASWDLADSALSPATLNPCIATRDASTSKVLSTGCFVPGTSGITPREYIAAAAAGLGIRSSVRASDGASPMEKRSQHTLCSKLPTGPPISPWTSVASEWNMSSVSPMLSLNRSSESMAKSPITVPSPSPGPLQSPSSCDTPQEPLRRRYATVELSPPDDQNVDVRRLRMSLRNRYSLPSTTGRSTLEQEASVTHDAESKNRRLSQEALQSHNSASLPAAAIDKWLAVAGQPRDWEAASSGPCTRAPSLQLPDLAEDPSTTTTTSTSPSSSPSPSPAPPKAESSLMATGSGIHASGVPLIRVAQHNSAQPPAQLHTPECTGPQPHQTVVPCSLADQAACSPTAAIGKPSFDLSPDGTVSSDTEGQQHLAVPIDLCTSASSPISSSSLQLPVPISPEIAAEVASCSASQGWHHAADINSTATYADKTCLGPLSQHSLSSHHLHEHNCRLLNRLQPQDKPTIDALCLHTLGSPEAILGTMAGSSAENATSSDQYSDVKASLCRPHRQSIESHCLSLPYVSEVLEALPRDTHIPDLAKDVNKQDSEHPALHPDRIEACESQAETSVLKHGPADELGPIVRTASFAVPAEEASEASSMAVPASGRRATLPPLPLSRSASLAFPAEESSEASIGRLPSGHSRVPKLRLPARRCPAASAPTAVRSSLSHSAHNSARGDPSLQPSDTSPPPLLRGSATDKAKSLPTGLRHPCVPGLQLAAVRSLPSCLQSGRGSNFDLMTPRELVRHLSPRLMTPPDTLASVIVGTGILMASPATVRSSMPFLSPRDSILEGLVTPRDSVCDTHGGAQGTPSSVIATGVIESPVPLTTTMLMGTMRSELSCRSVRSFSEQGFTQCTGVLSTGKLLTPSMVPPTPPPCPRQFYKRPPRSPPPLPQVASPSSADDTPDRTLQAIIAGVCGASSSFRSSPSPNFPTCCFATSTIESIQKEPSPMVCSPPTSQNLPDFSGALFATATPQSGRDPFPMPHTPVESKQISASPQQLRQSAAKVQFFHWKSMEDASAPAPCLVNSERRSSSSNASSPQDAPEAARSPPTSIVQPPTPSSQPRSACGLSTLSLQGSFCSAYRETWHDAMAALAIAKRNAACLPLHHAVCTPPSTQSSLARRLCVQAPDDSISEVEGPSAGEPSPLTSAHGFARSLPPWSPNPSTISTNCNARTLPLWKSPDQSVTTAPGTPPDTIASSGCDARTLPSPTPRQLLSPDSLADRTPLLGLPLCSDAQQQQSKAAGKKQGTLPGTSRKAIAFARRLQPITPEVGKGPIGLEPSPLCSAHGFARTLPPWSPCASTTRDVGSVSLAMNSPLGMHMTVTGPMRHDSATTSGHISSKEMPQLEAGSPGSFASSATKKPSRFSRLKDKIKSKVQRLVHRRNSKHEMRAA